MLLARRALMAISANRIMAELLLRIVAHNNGLVTAGQILPSTHSRRSLLRLALHLPQPLIDRPLPNRTQMFLYFRPIITPKGPLSARGRRENHRRNGLGSTHRAILTPLGWTA